MILSSCLGNIFCSLLFLYFSDFLLSIFPQDIYSSEDRAQEDTFLFVTFEKIPHRSQHLQALGCGLPRGGGGPRKPPLCHPTWTTQQERRGSARRSPDTTSATRSGDGPGGGQGRGQGGAAALSAAAAASPSARAPGSARNSLPGASPFDFPGNGVRRAPSSGAALLGGPGSLWRRRSCPSRPRAAGAGCRRRRSRSGWRRPCRW